MRKNRIHAKRLDTVLKTDSEINYEDENRTSAIGKYIVTKGKEGDNILVNHGICGLKDGKNNQRTDAEEHYVN